ncbi:MAG: hypothetical protein ABJC60_02165 [Actinomycetota bacterium]
MRRVSSSTACDVCAQPAVEVLGIREAHRSELLVAVCRTHLELMLRGARIVTSEPAARASHARAAPAGRGPEG